jgi:hypothetical protein
VVEFGIEGANLAVQESTGGPGIIANSSHHSAGMQHGAEPIRRMAGLANKAVVHCEDDIRRMGSHHVPRDAGDRSWRVVPNVREKRHLGRNVWSKAGDCTPLGTTSAEYKGRLVAEGRECDAKYPGGTLI